VKPPVVALAVKVVDVAIPPTVVVAVVVSVPFAKVPLAPLLGEVKVTMVPATNTGLLCESSIVTLNGDVNAVPIEAF
jgi:hypothetical protein